MILPTLKRSMFRSPVRVSALRYSQVRYSWTLASLLIAVLIASSFFIPWRASGQNEVSTVSAASFAAPVTPNSIAATFGTGLATETAVASGLPLPTDLAGTTVRVNGQLASLFFVSTGQVNYLLPAETAPGTATIEISAGNGAKATGKVAVVNAAPALFTANAQGTGLPAATLLRVKADGRQIFEAVKGPIEMGQPDDRVFLILFLCGVRNAGTSSRVIIGGVELTPAFAGGAPGFAGLDQINVELPRTLIGKGIVEMVVTAGGFSSNRTEIEMGGGAQPTPTPTPAPAPLQITSVAPTSALAGSELTINGAGFSAAADDNRVSIVDAQGAAFQAQMISASETQLKVRVPFGAGAGAVQVRTQQAQAQSSLNMRTSISGFIEEVERLASGEERRKPVKDITVRVRPPQGPSISQKTGDDGSFVVADVPQGLSLVDIDATTTTLPFPPRTFRMDVEANRDNQFPSTIELQQVLTTSQNSLSVNAGQQGGAVVTLPGSNANFGLPAGTNVTQSPSQNTSRLTLTLVDSGRTPWRLPAGYFSTAIAQISPYGAVMTPGGTLRLPNTGNLPFGTQLKLFRFEQPTASTPESSALGTFTEVGIGTVGSDGRIECRETGAQNGVRQTSYYFASPLYSTARITGRVIASDGTAVGRALVKTRGQSVFTGSDGLFTLATIPVLQTGDAVKIEVSYMRPDAKVDRTQTGLVPISANGSFTLDGDIVLPANTSADQPILLAPPRLTVNENQTLEFDFFASSRPVEGQAIQVAASGAGFASVVAKQNGVYALRLAPGFGSVGEYTLLLTAINTAGVKYLRNLSIRVRSPDPYLPYADDISLVTRSGVPVQFTLTGGDPLSRPFSLLFFSPPLGAPPLTGSLPNVIYSPRADFTGTDSFIYKAVVSNTSLQSEGAVVYVIVR